MRDFVITTAGERVPFGEDGYTSDGGPFVLVQLFEDGDPAAVELKAHDVIAQLRAKPDQDVFWHPPGAFVSGFHAGERDWSDVRPAFANLPRPLLEAQIANLETQIRRARSAILAGGELPPLVEALRGLETER